MWINFLRKFEWENYPKRPKGRWTRLIMRFVYVQIFLALIIAVPTLFIQYIAFPDFISTYYIPVWIYGLLIGITASVFIENYPHAKTESHSLAADIYMPIFTPFFMVTILGDAFFEGGPLIYSYLFGEPGSYVYTVESLSHNSRYCGSSIEIEEILGVLIDKICYVNHELWETLSVGDKVTVFGMKTPMGIRVHGLSLITTP